MSNYIKVLPAGNVWTRPAQWLAMPNIISTDKKFAGLFAIFNDRHNECGIQLNIGYNATINWGDGTSITGTAYPWVQNKVYNYSTISSPEITDEFGRVYKHVLVTIDINPLEGLFDMYVSQKSNHWLDIKLANTSLRTFGLCNVSKPICLKVIDMLSTTSVLALNQNYHGLELIERLRFDTSSNTIFAPFLSLGRNARDLNGNPINFTFTATNVGSGLSGINTDKIGTISLPNATDCSNFLRMQSQFVGDVSIPVATNLTSFCNGALNVRKVKLISSSNLLNLNQSFFDTPALEDLEITNCNGVTTTNLFSNSRALKRLILTGLTRAVNISNQNHNASSLNAFFTSLGTASGTQNVTITGNPGAATCNQSIATAKGWTVIN
jgi:hypothetical protein